MESAQDAIERLRAGNHRFIAGEMHQSSGDYKYRHGDLVDGQHPFAIILGCSDSRVPAELVFDQSCGSLFVIRVAGNVVAPSQIGSVEFAAEMFGTRLVVVLGHTRCGAISSTIDELNNPQENHSPNLRSIVDFIRPSVAPLMKTELRHDPEALQKAAIYANARTSAQQLVRGSEIIARLVAEKRLEIVCAEYSIETGTVTFFDSQTEVTDE